MWISIAICCWADGVWPDVPLWQLYFGKKIVLWPGCEELLPSVNLKVSSAAEVDDGFLLLRRFLSAASWSERVGFSEYLRTGSGSFSPTVGRGVRTPPYAPTLGRNPFPLEAPEVSDQRATLALSLYREGLCAFPLVFQFLSFYKILETRVGGRPKLIELSAKYMPAARKANQTLEKKLGGLGDPEVAGKLYGAGRCAIAHAHSEPLVDPDDPTGTQRVADWTPLIQSIAELVIENEYGISRYPPNSMKRTWEEIELRDGLPVAGSLPED